MKVLTIIVGHIQHPTGRMATMKTTVFENGELRGILIPDKVGAYR